MAWILSFIVCLTFLDMSLTYNYQPPQFWGWGWPYNQYQYSQIASTAYKYPIPSQIHSITVSPFTVEDAHEYNPKPDSHRSYFRSPQRGHDNRMYERSITSGSRGNLHGLFSHPQIEEPVRRSENISSKVLNNFLKPVRRRGQVDNNKITFPGPMVMPTISFRTSDSPEVPDSCKSQTFCENVPNYPQEQIDKLITELEGRAYSFPLDTIDLPDTPDINQRVGPTESNLELCNSKEKVIYPKLAKDADDKWQTLVNRDNDPVQGFRVEICEADESPCADFVYFQKGYSARCKQKFVLRTAVVAEKVGDTLQKVERPVQMPSCCSCVAKKDTGSGGD